ncbi:MAG: DUF3006 domain-containing protein [Acidaminococcaceae bacterium]
MKIQLTIDRFEGAVAVLVYGEAGDSIDWPANLLPPECQEGDVLALELAKDTAATQEALATTRQLLKKLIDGE